MPSTWDLRTTILDASVKPLKSRFFLKFCSLIFFTSTSFSIGLALAKSAISMGKKIAFAFGCETASDIRLHYFAASDYTRDKRTGGIRKVNNETLAVAFDEAKKLNDVNILLKIFGISSSVNQNSKVVLENLPKNLLRSSKFLTHPVFNKYHSETEMLRYLKKL